MRKGYLSPTYKQYYDPVHGYIPLTKLASHIIDTTEFKRLERLHQLGTCHYVFRGATHNRLEHSIGTYHLTNKLTQCIAERTDPTDLDRWLSKIPELQDYYRREDMKTGFFDPYVRELIKIAGLCHDLGHGPLSHVFDDVFLAHLPDTHPTKHHEARSCLILEKIILGSSFLSGVIHPMELEFIKNLINPPKGVSGFVYQIVSNNLNGIDVDKCDYLVRDCTNVGLKRNFDCQRLIEDIMVIDNTICYPRQALMAVVEMFILRYQMHKQIYTHKTVISIEFMLTEVMKLVDKHLRLTDAVRDIDYFCNLDEDFIRSVVKYHMLYSENPEPEFKVANELLERIDKRNLYRMVGRFIFERKMAVNKDELIDLAGLAEEMDRDNVLIYQAKIGYVSGNKTNPLDAVYYYDHKTIADSDDPPKKMLVDEHAYSKLLPNTYQEHILMVFYRNGNDRHFKMLEEMFPKWIEASRKID